MFKLFNKEPINGRLQVDIAKLLEKLKDTTFIYETFHIEYLDVSELDFVHEIVNQEDGLIEEWVNTFKEANRQEKIPLLIIRSNHGDPIILTDSWMADKLSMYFNQSYSAEIVIQDEEIIEMYKRVYAYNFKDVFLENSEDILKTMLTESVLN